MTSQPVKQRLKNAAYRFLLSKRRMLFPTFGDATNSALAQRQDYFRYATMSLALHRIGAEAVPGALAEVGVYRGETSEVLHTGAPDRTLYLFDTFEGFPAEHLEDWQRGDARFQDTSLSAVKARLDGAQRVVFRPGLVPDTLRGLEDERFAFVLLDMDLYEPTLQALEFFYARLNPGGYLLVHDYNNPESNWACKRAFDTFLADKPEPVVDIADVWGTALIRKARTA